MAFTRLETTPRYFCRAADPKPTAGIPLGATCWETDTNVLYQFTGTEWANKEFDLRGFLANQPAANTVVPGTTYWQIDTGDIELSDGAVWVKIGEV